MDKKEQARELFEKQGKSLSEIAEILGISPGTVRSWKSRGGWGSNVATQRNVAKKRCNATKETKPETPPAELVEPLTENERLFCEVYSRNKNATQAYLKVYGCTYNSAMTSAYDNLRKPKIKAYLNYLRKCQREAMNLQPIDIVERFMHIAFADMTDFVDYGTKVIPIIDGEGKVAGSTERDFLQFRDSQMVDGGVIKEVRQTQQGMAIKLESRMDALKWLSDYFEMNPADKHKQEIDKRRLEIELLKAQSSIKDTGESTIPDDGFAEALNSQAADVWQDGDNANPDWEEQNDDLDKD
ncbi:terminase small subunit [Clostridium sp. KNHs216]|uniref:terminase small subunit n=1 Tax=Clostridium sp. KNHs216 TaxID=1550235 RepID=UPI00114E3F70|nr:terminase small subunit [Clostridium sp. KNHs216]TQI66253.1 phage terminase small subunit [Clostridium sp. KNHs216]